MERKFTPGPWKLSFIDNKKLLYNHFISGADCKTITKIERHNRPPDDDMANAHLIAAAPELYEALEDAVELIEYLINATPTGKVRKTMCDLNIVARAALKKAKGE